MALLSPIPTYSQDLDSELIEAAKNGQTEMVQALLEAGAKVNAKKKNWTALTVAVWNGHTETAKVLLAGGAKVNEKTKVSEVSNIFGWTALMLAASGGHAESVQVLLDAGEKINAAIKVRRSPVSAPQVIAPTRQNTDTTADRIRHLRLQKRGILGEPNLHKGAQAGMTSLMMAAVEGHTNIVTILLETGADVNKKDKDGRMALMHASSYDQFSIVRCLLHAGAKVNVKDKYGSTALMRAAMSGNREIVQALLAKGAKVNAKDKYGLTALMLATGYSEVVELLKKAGAKE